MATTTVEPEQNVPPFTEHDKLGPLGTKTSVLENDHELRRALVGEFAATADAARAAAAKVDSDPQAAVHEYRKALRRARAVLSLVANALPKSERRAVRRALQEARRAVSVARDHAVAPEVINGLALDEISRDAANTAVANAEGTVQPSAELQQLLAEGAARAAAQVEALEAALPAELDWDTVARGVRTTYDAARRAHHAAKRSKRQFHAWRRRTKELTYQLDVLAGFAAGHVAELAHEIESVADSQSPAVDLVMVRDFMRTYGQGIAPEAFDQLVQTLDTQLDDLMRDSRSAGRSAFKRKPKKFIRRLTKAVRKDLTPPKADDLVTD
ncbi:MAG: CHAD domain-containing protein [Kofleriaceae bacterium]